MTTNIHAHPLLLQDKPDLERTCIARSALQPRQQKATHTCEAQGSEPPLSHLVTFFGRRFHVRIGRVAYQAEERGESGLRT